MLNRPGSVTWGEPIFMGAPFGRPHGNDLLLWERSVAVEAGGRTVILVSTTPTGSNQRPEAPSPLVALALQGGRLRDVTDEVLPSGIGASLLRGFQIGDFNGDGRPDVFLDNHGSEASFPFPGERNGLLLSDGRGGFTDGSGALPDFTDFSHGSVVADFNGDGRDDIFVSNLNDDESIPPYLLFGDGRGGFSAPVFFESRGGFTPGPGIDPAFDGGRSGYFPALIDWNDDGDLDIYFGPIFGFDTGRPVFEGFGYAENDGAGNFTLEIANQLSPPIPLARLTSGEFAGEHTRWGDFDNDGDLDLVIYWDTGGNGFLIQLLENRGAEGYVDVSNRIEGQEAGIGLPRIAGTPDFQLVDFDADGDLDIVVSRARPDFSGQRTLWFENEGGRFTRIDEAEFPGRQAFIFADLNGDGIPDFVNLVEVQDLPNTPRFDLGGHLAFASLGVIDRAVNRDGFVTDDAMAGGEFADVLRGRAGNDTLRGNGEDDRLIGGGGDDEAFGGAGDDRLIGNGGADRMRGQGGDDFARGGGGDDLVIGNGGDDRLFGNGGNDKLRGGGGNDTLSGGGGDDLLTGGGGNDRLIAGAGNDTLIGGRGADAFVFGANDDENLVRRYEDGTDRIEISGAGGFGGLTIAQDGADVTIAFRNTLIRVENALEGDFSAADFLF
ncbi:MAG: FG-GAP-like repeat-containing protein [Pikeienuella sp.]|uniref:FG-GAP-like repeat-containing protein n=1 Tax=Pikeienuella sp. TaxID=2831957 RepID=UPI003918BA63